MSGLILGAGASLFLVTAILIRDAIVTRDGGGRRVEGSTGEVET